jgi:hypothetical protein
MYNMQQGNTNRRKQHGKRWVVFHQTPDVPEALVAGSEMTYLSWFFHNLPFNPAAITQADIDEYVNHYSAPGGMHAGFEHYRAFPQDAIQNQNYSKTKLTMPGARRGIYSNVRR